LPVTSSGKTTIIAHNTDVRALADELARGQSGPAAALVIGDGGGALAAVAACRSLGVRRVTVAARRYRGERDASWTTATSFEALGARPVAWPPDSRVDSEFRRAALSSDLIVQSTSDGMRGATDGTSVRDVVPWNELPSTTFAYDLVYNPPVTPFLSAAKSRGLGCESGLGMLVGQAVLALELWFGRRPDPSALREAAERTLAEKFPA